LSQSGYFPTFKEPFDGHRRVFCFIHNETISPYCRDCQG
jgi:hypothetical protein